MDMCLVLFSFCSCRYENGTYRLRSWRWWTGSAAGGLARSTRASGTATLPSKSSTWTTLTITTKRLKRSRARYKPLFVPSQKALSKFAGFYFPTGSVVYFLAPSSKASFEVASFVQLHTFISTSLSTCNSCTNFDYSFANSQKISFNCSYAKFFLILCTLSKVLFGLAVRVQIRFVFLMHSLKSLLWTCNSL